MAFDSENPATPAVNGLEDALKSKGRLSEDNPEIVAIFQQLKNLREADRSLRSLRRTMTLDNMPMLEPIAEEVEEAPEAAAPEAPRNDLEQLLESFVELKQEKATLEARFAQMMDAVGQLQETVQKQAAEIEKLRQG